MLVRDEDRKLCKKIVQDEIDRTGYGQLQNHCDEIVETILEISYSKGGGYSEATLNSFTKVFFKENYIKNTYKQI